MKLSVLIPYFNVEKYVDDLLSSLKPHKDNIEVLFYNDCSTDRSEVLLIEGANNLGLVFSSYHGSQNIGYQEAINFLWNKLEDDSLVAFHDADDLWQKNYSFEVIKCFANHDLDYVYTNTIRFSDKTNLSNRTKSMEYTVGSGIVFRKSVIKSNVLFLNCFKGIGCEDLYLMNYLTNNCNGTYLDNVNYLYRYNVASLSFHNGAIQPRIIKSLLKLVSFSSYDNTPLPIKLLCSKGVTRSLFVLEIILKPFRRFRRNRAVSNKSST